MSKMKWVLILCLFLGGCEFKKLSPEATDYINNRLFPPQNTMLGSAKEANKRFEEFEKLLSVSLQRAENNTLVEPMLTENIDCILEALRKYE